MKTLIAIPCMDQVPALFAQSLATMRMVGECQIAFQIGSLIYTSRDDLARYAMKEGFDYVLWLDSDMIFPEDFHERMFKTLTENNLDILSGIYYKRKPPYSPVIFDKMQLKGKIWDYSWLEDVPDSLFEVGACGFGCVLLKTEVLMSVQLKHGYLFHPMQNGGEDVAFCVRARDCGYKIMCDPSIVCGHVGNVVITDTLYKQYRSLSDTIKQ
jgi:GT2 family glycosyltransferase